MTTDLRRSLIHLAHENPELRPEILPLLGEKTAVRFTIPRSSVLPKNNPTLKREETPEGLEIWSWDMDGRIVAAAWAGKSEKPLWYRRFRDDAARSQMIVDQVVSYEAQVEVKRKRLEEKKNFEHGLQVDDILYSSWGYDQTNVDFYQVTALRGKQVVLREISKKVVREERGADYVVAQPHHFTGPEIKKIPQTSGGDRMYVKIDNSQWAYKWDGKPQYQTAGGWGH